MQSSSENLNQESMQVNREITNTGLNICEKCGWEKKNYYEVYKGVGIFYACECERKLEVAKVENEITEEKKNHIKQLFSRANVGRRFANCTLQNFKVTPENESVHRACVNFVNNLSDTLERGDGLLIYGKPGNGKTHLASSIVKEAVNKGHSSIFQPAAELQYRLNATYNDSGESELEIINGLVEAELVVIDDLGKGKWSEKVAERFYIILDGRYREMRSTVITTNLKLSELEEYVGIAVFDRLKEMVVFVHNKADSFRG